MPTFITQLKEDGSIFGLDLDRIVEFKGNAQEIMLRLMDGEKWITYDESKSTLLYGALCQRFRLTAQAEQQATVTLPDVSPISYGTFYCIKCDKSVKGSDRQCAACKTQNPMNSAYTPTETAMCPICSKGCRYSGISPVPAGEYIELNEVWTCQTCGESLNKLIGTTALVKEEN